MRKKHRKEPLPVVGDRQYVDWLPRDIRLDLSKDAQVGTLLQGWCETTETRQLWEVVNIGEKPLARFVGFIVEKL